MNLQDADMREIAIEQVKALNRLCGHANNLDNDLRRIADAIRKNTGAAKARTAVMEKHFEHMQTSFEESQDKDRAISAERWREATQTTEEGEE